MKRINIVFVLVMLLFQSCYVGRFVFLNFADIKDYNKFPYREIHRAGTPFIFAEAGGNAGIKLPVQQNTDKPMTFEKRLEKSNTISFLVIRRDTVIYEWMHEGTDRSKVVPSFSMAKSYISALIGIAIQEGKIKSTAESITNYIDGLDSNFEKITIQHLLDMQSGIRFNENYFNPFGEVAKFYYGTNLKKYVTQLRVEKAPGGEFRYLSVNTQLLGLILEKAIGQSVSSYLQEKIWEPLGMEFDASWSIDSKKNGTEKAFCCINARARDFAKFGRLYLNSGNWNGKQIINQNWIEQSTTFSTAKNHFSYSNQWWHTKNYYRLSDTTKIKTLYELSQKSEKNEAYAYGPSGDYFAQGHLGQFIYVQPSTQTIIVRLGKNEGGIYWPALMREIGKMNKN